MPKLEEPRHSPLPAAPQEATPTWMISGMNTRSRCLTRVEGMGTLLPLSL
jgi:hypothetical protein